MCACVLQSPLGQTELAVVGRQSADTSSVSMEVVAESQPPSKPGAALGSKEVEEERSGSNSMSLKKPVRNTVSEQKVPKASHTQSNFVAGNCCQQQNCLVYDK